MMLSNTLPSQFNFRFLSVPDLQPVACMLDAMDHDAVSRSGSSKQTKAARPGSSDSAKAARLNKDAYVPFNYICPDAYDLLAAAEAAAARRADDMDAKSTEITMLDGANFGSLSLQSAMDGWHGPGSILPKMPPPKRFYRISWQSLSLQLLHRWANTASLSSNRCY